MMTITQTTDHGTPDAAAAFATSARALQRASNLLDLLTDEQIWQRMLDAGLPDDWRAELDTSLAAARADYRRRWSLHQGPAAAGGTSGASPAGTDASSCDAQLGVVVARISVAGRALFGATESLAYRFAAVAHDPRAPR